MFRALTCISNYSRRFVKMSTTEVSCSCVSSAVAPPPPPPAPKSASSSPAAASAASASSVTCASGKHVPIPARGVDYRGKLVLAPMVRSGEIATRLTSLQYGADLVWGPETIDRALIGAVRYECPRTGTVYWTRKPHHGKREPDAETKESVIYRLHPQREGKQLVFQLGSASPELAVQAARVVAADVAGIDLNSGCPKPFSTLGGMGAALLKDPDRLCSILEALVREIADEFEIGISVKIRILDKAEDTEALVRRLVKTGIIGLTVHCRTTLMRPRDRAIRQQLKMIANVCREAGVACLMNGDVQGRDEAQKLMQEFGVDGAMIATAAEKNPSVFRAGPALPWNRVARDYLHNALTVDNRYRNTKFMIAHIVNAKQLPDQKWQQASNNQELVVRLGFEDLYEQAREADVNNGLLDRTHKQKKGRKRPLTTEDNMPTDHSRKKPAFQSHVSESEEALHFQKPSVTEAALVG